ELLFLPPLPCPGAPTWTGSPWARSPSPSSRTGASSATRGSSQWSSRSESRSGRRAEDAAVLRQGARGLHLHLHLLGLAGLVLFEDLGRVLGDLREFGLELADLAGAPYRGAELVVSDRCHHEKPG